MQLGRAKSDDPSIRTASKIGTQSVDWPVARVKNFRDFQKLVFDLPDTGRIPGLPYLFRGQPDSLWSLAPSSVRTLKQVDPLEYEQWATSQFLAQAHSYIPLPSFRLSDVEIWILMQHHGSPRSE